MLIPVDRESLKLLLLLTCLTVFSSNLLRANAFKRFFINVFACSAIETVDIVTGFHSCLFKNNNNNNKIVKKF